MELDVLTFHNNKILVPNSKITRLKCIFFLKWHFWCLAAHAENSQNLNKYTIVLDYFFPFKKEFKKVPGNFLGFLIGTNFAPIAKAIGGPNIKPLASIPAN